MVTACHIFQKYTLINIRYKTVSNLHILNHYFEYVNELTNIPAILRNIKFIKSNSPIFLFKIISFI